MATILEGLNQIAQAVGGTGEAESNLEALNQISEALGGSADATENADAVANIAENASGGGGSSDFTTATVTFTNSSSSPDTTASISGLVAILENHLSSEPIIANGGETITVDFVVYKNQPVQAYVGQGTYVSSSGAVEYDDGDLVITGDFSITILGRSAS